jgi:three-Cys-motif partner protein
VGRPPNKKGSIGDHPSLFADGQLPQIPLKLPEKNFTSLRFPLWTHNKARLIQEYLRLFEFITHHGTYIDGFAAPQESAHPEMWAAKLVLEIEPKWFREFWLCDIDPIGIVRLEGLRAQHQSAQRKIDVLPGDFNKSVYQILSSGRIGENTATFALLDQRTFECEWQTVVALSRHKRQRKIEQFYFFPTGWIDRSIGAVRAPETVAKVERWWGKSDWLQLRGMDGIIRAKLVAKRFEDELGYGKATVYPIHSERRGGRVMYHMIHATDHPEASPLMIRAYRKVSGRSDLEIEGVQVDFEELWRKIEADED